MVTKVLIAGKNGMVGSALVRLYDSFSNFEVLSPTRQELDLLDRNLVFEYLSKNKPDLVVDAAARVGGIVDNNSYPVDFLSINLQIQTNLMDAAAKAGVKNFVFLGSSCIYPKFAPQPLKEEFLLSGPLEETNSAYAIAKIAGLRLIQAYREQYGYSWISTMPTNLYGPNDNFDFNSSHVIPGLIAKFHKAKIEKQNKVTLWGTGSALREFLHVDDLARAIKFTSEKYNDHEFINIGSGEEVAIKQLAELVRQVVGFEGEIKWDSSYPDGTPQKLLDSSKILKLGWKPEIALAEGLASTYNWFLENTK
ncbi:MAG: GDP-L-fucose synthase [Candidatus Nanopelagicales bacterium]